MNLRDLNLKITYDSTVDDILNHFFIPLLSNSIEYQRSVGFFSSKILSVAAEGFSTFISNGGRMKIICGTKLKAKDLEVIHQAHKNPKKAVEEFLGDDSHTLEEKFANDNSKALGWMIATGKLKIKIARVLDLDGMPVDEKNGILHQKIGIFRDNDGNFLSFSGSNNETASGWKSNIEEFKVFRNWKSSELSYFDSDVKKFDNIWNGKVKEIEIIDAATAIKERIIRIIPDVKEDGYGLGKVKKIKEKIVLWDYQNEAIKNWTNNGKRGIFEMATGTGKTFTALGCLSQELKNNEKLLVVISCPYQHLVQQWKQSFYKFGLDFDELIIADSSNSSWKPDLADCLIDISLDDKDHVVVITTHTTFSSNNFIQILKNKGNYPVFLIADEVHGLGAEISLNGLTDVYDYRLGLSATPKRWFDEEGTEALYNYFNDVVYQFSLQKAITKLNPGSGETYLTPYIYLPRFLSLDNEELDEYIRKTKAITTNYYSKSKEKEKTLRSLLLARSNIIKNASAKFKLLEQILDEIDEIENLIIYCSPQQMDRVMNIINQRNIRSHRFTMQESTKPHIRYEGRSEREFILDKFAEGEYQTLVAMKCLDEGVDVPAAKTAIFMSSSGNPREYIQRIGRVIRMFPGKERAIIYDMIVKPSTGKIYPEIKEIEQKIFEKEFERYEEIAKVALNNVEALETVFKIRSNGGI